MGIRTKRWGKVGSKIMAIWITIIELITEAREMKDFFAKICREMYGKQRRKGKIHPFECRVPKIARRDKIAFLSEQCKRNRGKQQNGKD